MTTLPLASEEKVLVVGRPALTSVWLRYVLSLGIYGFWRRRRLSVLTDRRVMLGQGFLSRQERSIPINMISDATYARRGLAGSCRITSSNGWVRSTTNVGPLPTRIARRFTYELQGRLSMR